MRRSIAVAGNCRYTALERMPKFTVDTHLFRELGELLVGRDSTALVELIKNAYDADATHVTVHGEQLSEPGKGRIVITDDGTGMTPEKFEAGFLRIASRLKEEGDRRSPKYKRRYTGAKGVGRLAAHKLAKFMQVYSIPDPEIEGRSAQAITATIDWDRIEALETLDDIESADAISLEPEDRPKRAVSGTAIELRRLRRKWSEAERSRFFWEVQQFRPPDALVHKPAVAAVPRLLFDEPLISDTKGRTDPNINVELTGELEVGEDYWQNILESADWILEIDAAPGQQVQYLIAPTKRRREELPGVQAGRYSIPHPSPDAGPFFQARILIREGRAKGNKGQNEWVGRNGGIRVYMEGFRVLPYGEPGDDWLKIDADVVQRLRTLRYLENLPSVGAARDEEEGLSALRNAHHFGAVFLTQDRAKNLRMLVNREGFVPEAGYDQLVTMIRRGVDLSVRVRTLATTLVREERRTSRQQPKTPTREELKIFIEKEAGEAAELTAEARKRLATGDVAAAAGLVERAAEKFVAGSEAHDRLLSERSMTQILAAVGLQMTQFVHEVNSLLGMSRSIESAVTALREDKTLSPSIRRGLGELQSAVGDMRRAVERQASYLTDVSSPDARRRRSKQKLAERFDAAARLVEPAAERREIRINNQINPDLKSPPMFKAEITLIFTNLLTNAVKAAGKRGKIRAWCPKPTEDKVAVRIENTGVRVKLDNSERWFRPFETTTTDVDPILGQGMGMGLPITRKMLEEYGADIRFVRPSEGYNTALEIHFPLR